MWPTGSARLPSWQSLPFLNHKRVMLLTPLAWNIVGRNFWELFQIFKIYWSRWRAYAISKMLIQAITEHTCRRLDRRILALPVCIGGLGMKNPCLEANFEQPSSVKVTTPLVWQIVAQSNQMPDGQVPCQATTTGSEEWESKCAPRQGSAYQRGGSTESPANTWPCRGKRVFSLADSASLSWNEFQPK